MSVIDSTRQTPNRPVKPPDAQTADGRPTFRRPKIVLPVPTPALKFQKVQPIDDEVLLEATRKGIAHHQIRRAQRRESWLPLAEIDSSNIAAKAYPRIARTGMKEFPSAQENPFTDTGSDWSGLFRQEGDYWTVGHGKRVFRLNDCLGLSFISYLLRHPGTEFHVLDLGAGATEREPARDQAKQSSGSLPINAEELEASGIHVGGLGDAGEMLDEQAKAAYKARLGELRDELEEAKEFGDVERAARAEEEIDALGAELSRGIGLGGRHRRAGSATERARQRAKKNIKTAIGRIARHDPELGRMFSRCIRTGIYCSYIPDPRFQVTWQFAETTSTSAASLMDSGSSEAVAGQAPPAPPVSFDVDVRNGSHSGSAVQAQPRHARLVGRERALGELRDSLGTALRDRRQVVFITGEPGIGKTALADEFQSRASAEVPGLRIARGQCVEGYGSKEAYYPILEALGELCRVSKGESVIQTLAADAPTWLVQFPALVKPEQRETLQRELLGATRERMLREIGDALETITATSPLLLVFEDLQWADHSTVDFISALARRRARAKLMLIATKRPVDMVVPEHPLKILKQDLLLHQLCREITLEPLGEAEVAEYLASESSEATLPEGLAKLLYRHSDGNPLFMVAALDHMIERGFLSRANGGWKLKVAVEEVALEVPQKLRRMIEAQIDGLTPETQRVLEAASVAGMVFSGEVCAKATNLDPETFEELCEELSRRHHIVRSAGSAHLPIGTVSGGYEFVHALYREVFYRRLASGRRARLHQTIGEQMETTFSDRLSEAAPELARHFEHASDWPRAVKYLGVAAETARRRYANREATALLQHALDLATRLPEAARGVSELKILEKLGMIHASEYDPSAIENYEAMASQAARLGLIDAEARALVNLAYPLAWFSSERCLAVLERAFQLSDSQTDRLLRAITRMLSSHYRIWAGGWNSRDAEGIRNMLDEIREVGDPVTLAFSLAVCGMHQWASSEYREARRNLTEAVTYLLETSDDYLNLSLVFWVHQLWSPSSLFFLGEWGGAFREFRAGITMLERNSDEYRANTLRLYLAWAHLHAMDFEGALKICESSFSHPENSVISTESGSSGALPEEARISFIVKGSAQLALGNYDMALENLLTARNAIDQRMVILDWYWRIQLQSSLTELWLAKEDLKQARIEAERFLQVALATAERTWQALAWETNARIAIAELDLDRARDCTAKALSTMEGFEVPLAAWRVHATAAELHRASDNIESANHHRELSRATILKLADSLATEEPLRKTFLSAPSVRKVLGSVEAS
jgi:tetratricopeptide (TPR) repeat protein